MEKNTKPQIRERYRARRDALTAEEAADASRQICAHILAWDVCRKARRMYFYYPLGKEVSLLPVVEDAFARGKRAAFPKVDGMDMDFYEVSGMEEFSEGCFHVREPRAEGKRPVAWETALCFVPGTAFDRSGSRLGYGKGYYDRYFAGKDGVILIGCAYGVQIAEGNDRLAAEPHDIRMDYLVSESGVLNCRAE